MHWPQPQSAVCSVHKHAALKLSKQSWQGGKREAKCLGRSIARCVWNKGPCLKQTRQLYTGVYLESPAVDNCFQCIEVSNYLQVSAQCSHHRRIVGEGREGWWVQLVLSLVGTDRLRARNSSPPSASWPPTLKGAMAVDQWELVCLSHDRSILTEKCKHLANI